MGSRIHHGGLASDISGLVNESSPKLRVCVCVDVLPLFPQRIDYLQSYTSVCFSFPIFCWQQLPLFSSSHTSRGLASHSLPDVHVLGCSWRRHAHTRGAEQAQVFLRAPSTASTRCGFSKHMTSAITGMGALNRLKFCTYVARQQRNRSQSPLPLPPPPPPPLTHSPLSSALVGLLRCYH